MSLDRVDPPGVVAQRERLADPPFEDELLVELTQPRTIRTQENRVLTGIGYCSAAHQRKLRRTGQGGQTIVNAIPGDPRAKIAREPVGNRPETRQSTLSKTSGARSSNG